MGKVCPVLKTNPKEINSSKKQKKKKKKKKRG